MTLPNEVPVMTLPSATLFPQALLPLYIFEPRYRRMLADVLSSHRMFCVAMQKPAAKRESPISIAGLGFVRAAVDHPDGTSHLILQGVARIELDKAVRYRPYRVHRIRVLSTPPCDSVEADALVLQVRDLLNERFKLDPSIKSALPALPAKEVIRYLDKLSSPEMVADLVSCTLLEGADQRQVMLETMTVEARLKRLIRFLIDDIHRLQKDKP